MAFASAPAIGSLRPYEEGDACSSDTASPFRKVFDYLLPPGDHLFELDDMVGFRALPCDSLAEALVSGCSAEVEWAGLSRGLSGVALALMF